MVFAHSVCSVALTLAALATEYAICLSKNRRNIVQIKLEKTYRLNTKAIFMANPIHFILIGAGGTGGYLVPNLARQISVLNHDMKTNHQLTICDADIVEVPNLIRQNFIPQDINQNKASVLAQRYSAAFGIQIAYKDEYIESETALNFLARELHPKAVPVIIGAVDNNKTRQMITSVFKASQKHTFYLDSGKPLHCLSIKSRELLEVPKAA